MFSVHFAYQKTSFPSEKCAPPDIGVASCMPNTQTLSTVPVGGLLIVLADETKVVPSASGSILSLL